MGFQEDSGNSLGLLEKSTVSSQATTDLRCTSSQDSLGGFIGGAANWDLNHHCRRLLRSPFLRLQRNLNEFPWNSEILGIRDRRAKIGDDFIPMADRSAERVTRTRIRAEIAGNRLELIESGKARLALLLELIAGAERSIRMLMYMFNADAAGRSVRDALAAAARRGIALTPSSTFAVAHGHAPNAVRLALAPPSFEQLDSGLRTIVSLLGTKEEDFDSTE